MITKKWFRFITGDTHLCTCSILCLVIVNFVTAATYYVAPNGNDDHSGTVEEPFGSLKKGSDKALAGDTVYIRGGVFNMSSGISIRKSGSSDSRRIYFFAYRNEHPVFDFSGITSQTNGVTISNSEWLHFKGLQFCNVPQLNGTTPNCVLCDHSGHITFERCEFHHNGGQAFLSLTAPGGIWYSIAIRITITIPYRARATVRTRTGSVCIIRQQKLIPLLYGDVGGGGTLMTVLIAFTRIPLSSLKTAGSGSTGTNPAQWNGHWPAMGRVSKPAGTICRRTGYL